MKPYGGTRDKRACPIHGAGCGILYKFGKEARRATRKSARRKAKQKIEEEVTQCTVNPKVA